MSKPDLSFDPRPILAITLGDPAGVGPEIIVKALRHAAIYEVCRPLVIGDRRMLARAAEWVSTGALNIRTMLHMYNSAHIRVDCKEWWYPRCLQDCHRNRSCISWRMVM